MGHRANRGGHVATAFYSPRCRRTTGQATILVFRPDIIEDIWSVRSSGANFTAAEPVAGLSIAGRHSCGETCMKEKIDFELLSNPEELARYRGWSEEIYRDLLSVEENRMSEAEFDDKYLSEKAILVLDLTGFTETAMRQGAVHSFVRVLDAHKLCLPVLSDQRADFVRVFADDIVALFPEPDQALDAALEIHRRTNSNAWQKDSSIQHAHCCIGLGFGPVYSIGPNLAMGDEMNRASKLGEDIARGGETLVSEGAYQALRARSDVVFEEQVTDDPLFGYYRVDQCQ